MTLRCRLGDLAVIVGGDRPEFIGRIVRITRACHVYPDSWDTEPALWVDGYLLPCSVRDRTLRPIRPDADPVDVEHQEPAEVTA